LSVLRILRVLAPNADVFTLEGTNTWVVGELPAVVIDPGPDIPEHLDEVARSAGPVGAVLVTHDHPDHAMGAGAFARRVGAPLRARRVEGADFLHEGEQLRVGDVRLNAIHTPGHASDHVSFHLPSERALFTGDAVLGRGTSFIDPPDGDMRQYMRSLGRMRELKPRTLYPGHGPVVLDAGGKLQEYVAHREEREAQVLGLLAAGPSAIMPMVRSIYAGYPPDAHPLAARSVLAHLLKLQAEGRVGRRGKGIDAEWRSVEPRACARCGEPVRGRARLCSSCSVVALQEGAGVVPQVPNADPQFLREFPRTDPSDS
jgi:glyoxylase-like metal-dependent hydrolase (beta-lactamase superfamily II)